MSADLVLTNGRVFTADPARGPATTVAVRAGRVVAVGADDVRELTGPATTTVDLAGRLLLPGFQDAHVHAVMGGVELGQCDLTGAPDLDACLRRIRDHADAHPELPWITGGGWAMEVFPGGVPDREPLDRVVPDRPVYLINRDHHGAWVNSRALALAGIDAATPDPADGRIDRRPGGAPAGGLQEGAMQLVARLLPAVTPAERLAGLLRAQTLLHSLGITAWQDAMLCATNGYPDVSDAYLAAATTGQLTATVVGALWWDRDRGAEQIPELLANRDRHTVGRLRCDSVKLMLDGVAENFTAAMTSPYRDSCGRTTANTGLSFIDPAALRSHVTELDAHGFQVHFHALGDRAVREALDAVEAARTANGFRDTRPHLAHLQVVHPDDIPRFRALGAAANLQPFWASHEPQMDDLTIPFLDPALAARQYPFGDLQRAGVHLACGSDWPVSTPDPLQGIHVAVNRVHHGAGHPPFLPDQRLDLATALTAYTAGAAFVNRLDDTGVIRAGARADLVVLDRDPFAGRPEEIGAASVAMTFIDGRLVHAAGRK
ncbi:amidohydrolase [Actinoplanes sp. SE50]|uniref:amidohydrolase n=1 Tax=unclassified Actinoplanes TaxID=2626549 RepID=UPI00023EBF90|nr:MULTISPECIES: amidohydrolase [unclassified Actinoplanes]AEV86323.1 Putative amidohydrolase ytcJ [Actinoplanes sp. SE50/110]ATO84720.1 amidohydrolase [Actinoplanes sp. SE50]SLM02130.1 amidohydrolase [Actinoplanes sp. SE50/110]